MINFMYYWRPKIEQAIQQLVDRMTHITWTGFGRTEGWPIYEPRDGEAIALD